MFPNTGWETDVTKHIGFIDSAVERLSKSLKGAGDRSYDLIDSERNSWTGTAAEFVLANKLEQDLDTPVIDPWWQALANRTSNRGKDVVVYGVGLEGKSTYAVDQWNGILYDRCAIGDARMINQWRWDETENRSRELEYWKKFLPDCLYILLNRIGNKYSFACWCDKQLFLTRWKLEPMDRDDKKIILKFGDPTIGIFWEHGNHDWNALLTEIQKRTYATTP